MATYLTYILTQKPQIFKVLSLNIPAAIVETFARLLIFDPDNFIKYLSHNVWTVLVNPSSNAVIAQQSSISNNLPAVFLNQQINLLVELICFRLKHLSFSHRTTFLFYLNSLFTSGSNSSGLQQQQQQQQQPHQPGQAPQQQAQQQQQQRNDMVNFIKHPQIYINVQCAMLKLLSSFSGSDYYELLNSIYASTKHAPKTFINPDSEEINKAIVLIIARAVHLTCKYYFIKTGILNSHYFSH